MTPDGLPVIGALPSADNVFVAGGHGMLGLTLAPATGKMIAAMVTGDPGALDQGTLRAVSPARFARRGRRPTRGTRTPGIRATTS